MKLLIKLGDKYAEIFRVNFRKSRKKSVIGEMLLFHHMEAQIPNATKIHSHFIYFEDGNYHFSIKYYDTQERLWIDRKTYHQQIAIRKSTSPDFKAENEVSYERRDKKPDDLLDMFMRDERSKPWTERPLNHHFGTFSMHSDGEYADKFEWGNIEVDAEDLVISYQNYKDHTLNFNAVLYDKENPVFQNNGVNAFPDYEEKIIEQWGLVVKFSMTTTFNPSTDTKRA